MSDGMDQEVPTAPVAKRRNRGIVMSGFNRFIRLLTGLASAALMLAVLVTGGIYVRLTSGPINLTTYLPQIESLISDRLPGARLSLGAAEIALEGDNGGAVLVARDIVLIDPEDGPFARVPRAEGSFRIWDVLMGRFLPSDVALDGISARLVRDRSGAFRFGFGGMVDNEAGGEGSGAFNRLLAALAEESEANAANGGATSPADVAPAAEQGLRLLNASIFYDDRLSGRTYRTENAEVGIMTLADKIVATGRLSMDGGRHGEVRIAINGERAETGDVALSATFDNAAPRDLAGQIPALDWMAAFDAPVGGRIALSMNAAGDLLTLSGAFKGGSGAVRIDQDTVEKIASTALVFDYDPSEERFLIEDMSIDADRTSFRGSGFVEVNRDERGAPEDIVAQLDFDGIRVSAPEMIDQALTYDAGRFTGRVTLAPFMIEIGEMRLERTAMQIATAGRIWQEGDGWRADLTAGASDFSLEEMLAHWPRTAAPGALVWMRDNMETAHVIDADAVLRLGGDAEEVKIDFSFDNAIGHYLRPMPPVRGGVGSGQVDLKRFSLGLDSGTVTPLDGAPIDLAGSTFVIEDLEHPDTPGTATIVARGAIRDALALIDSEPLKLTSALGVPLGDVAGDAVIRAVSTFPLLKDLLLEDVTAEAKAVFSDVALNAPGIDKPVTAEALALDASTSGFVLSGNATIAGLPLSLIWDEVFSPSRRSIKATGTATPARLAEFGIEQDWFIEGSIPISATVVPGAATTGFSLSADLSRAAVNIPEIGWQKPVGNKGKLTAAGSVSGEKIVLDQLSFDTPSLSFAGTAETDATGYPSAIDLSRVRFREAVDLALKARFADGSWTVRADGPLLDLTGLRDITDRLSEGGEVSGGQPFLARLRIDRVRLTEDYYFEALRGRVARDAAGELTGRLSGNVSGGAEAVLNFIRGPEGGRITLRAPDAGRLMRDAAVFDDGSGGELVINARILPGDALRLAGRVTVDDIVIHEDAKLEQLLIGADLADLRQTMRDDGIVFKSIVAPFAYDGDVLTLDEAVAKGPSIGVNISGDYLMATDTLDMDGVFTPLYGLNSALGNIPLIGDILVGGKGQGVFAFNFSVSGSAEDPNVSVNPLSVLTPGIFRRIFDIGDASQEIDPNAPVPPKRTDQ